MMSEPSSARSDVGGVPSLHPRDRHSSPGNMISVLPALENLQRMSHERPPQPILSGASPFTPATPRPHSGNIPYAPASPSQHVTSNVFPSQQVPSASHANPQQQVHPRVPASHTSQPSLPTYREASSEDWSQFLTSQGSRFPPAGSSPPRTTRPRSLDNPHAIDSTLPDILNSHRLPQIPPARPNQHRHQRNRDRATRGGHRPSNPRPTESQDERARRSRHRPPEERRRSSSGHSHEGTCKEPCVKCVVTITSFRWVLVMLSVVGVCCVVTGIILAALHAAGKSFLFLAIMFLGFGVLLVIVVGVGWRCTPSGHEPLHSLFGIGNFRTGQTRERTRRRRRNRHRDSNWFGGVLYPEFQYRRPPPSYAASMQDYQHQVSQAESQATSRESRAASRNDGDSSLPNSPPPSYRSRASTLHAFPTGTDGDHPSSRPPTYRSRAPSRRPSLPRERLSSDSSNIAPADVCFTGPSTDAATNAASTSEPHSLIPAVDYSPTEETVPSTVMQVYTVPLTSDSVALNPEPNGLPSDTQILPLNESTTVDVPTVSLTQLNVVSESPPSNVAAPSSVVVRGIPSLHQRMESQDRVQLEQALQSLEEHIGEAGGITNMAASFDDASFNTYL